jgi:hypothetical protein
MEAAERERIQQAKAEKAKMAADRHAEQVAALANLQKALDALANEGNANKAANDEKSKAADKRRLEKAARDKKITEALDKLVVERDEAKKQKAVDDKKPGTQAILDALK